jgi:uncharacterized protein YggE
LDLLKVDDAYIYKLDYSKREEIEKMVRIEAISNAKGNAQDLLGAVGSKVGKPLKVAKGNHYDYSKDNVGYRNSYKAKTSYFLSEDVASFDGNFQTIKIEYAVDCWFEIE